MNGAHQATAALALAASLLPAGDGAWAGAGAKPAGIRIFDGKPKRLIVHGYSTSFRWPRILQRKLDRRAGGESPLRVLMATAGGTPIAKWMDLRTGEPRPVWRERLTPKLREKGVAIVLAQQSLQWAFGARGEGIRGPEDRERIARGADVIQAYARLLLEDGADLVFIACHIYKHPMEPEIGNERLALAALMERHIAGVERGPDVWTATRRLYPKAFARDGLHPGPVGIEVMAQLWFETLLAHDGLPVPAWSREEMEEAIRHGDPRHRAGRRRERRVPREPGGGPAGRGLVAARADYRVRGRHGTGPDRCVEDGKSAIRWLRQHADELGIDPARIAAGGGSAGGHVAAAAFAVPDLEAEGEDRSISCRPNLLVLFNPVLNTRPLAGRLVPEALARRISPNDHLTKDMPPAIIFFGTEDRLKAGGEEYIEKGRALGLTAELWLAGGARHGFFNRTPWTEQTLYLADRFLARHGYLRGEPTIALEGGIRLEKATSPK